MRCCALAGFALYGFRLDVSNAAIHRNHERDMTMGKLDAFTRQYLETALWSSTDNSRDDGGGPLDQNYDICNAVEGCRIRYPRKAKRASQG